MTSSWPPAPTNWRRQPKGASRRGSSGSTAGRQPARTCRMTASRSVLRRFCGFGVVRPLTPALSPRGRGGVAFAAVVLANERCSSMWGRSCGFGAVCPLSSALSHSSRGGVALAAVVLANEQCSSMLGDSAVLMPSAPSPRPSPSGGERVWRLRQWCWQTSDIRACWAILRFWCRLPPGSLPLG